MVGQADTVRAAERLPGPSHAEGTFASALFPDWV
jgi:hypothetical protein